MVRQPGIREMNNFPLPVEINMYPVRTGYLLTILETIVTVTEMNIVC
jgi:hypothetical protein